MQHVYYLEEFWEEKRLAALLALQAAFQMRALALAGKRQRLLGGMAD